MHEVRGTTPVVTENFIFQSLYKKIIPQKTMLDKRKVHGEEKSLYIKT